jgi:hypothetical protein
LGINQLVTQITFYFSTSYLQTSSPQQRGWTFAIKTLHALGSLKHVIQYHPFVSFHKAQFHFECYTNDKGSNQLKMYNASLEAPALLAI